MQKGPGFPGPFSFCDSRNCRCRRGLRRAREGLLLHSLVGEEIVCDYPVAG